ncbi:hypothetical protein [Algicola sagamiensis]|uniref:hypothetical protein n=1 Tax=Algicola sagamiensis TaxID=163869 RepID=UPI00035DA86D|nr:hypothetical protein [Algicola sagamiensis]
MKYSKPSTLAASVAVLLSTTGCEQREPAVEVSQKDLSQAIEQEANQELLQQMTKEKQELKAFLQEMQAKDPSIVDAYYSFDDNGEKVLNVIREKEPEGTQTEGSESTPVAESQGLSGAEVMLYALAGGLTAAALAKAFSNKSPQAFRSGASSHYSTTMKDAQKRKNFARSGYLSKMKSKKISSIKSNPSKLSSVKKGVFNRKSSTRSSSYSSGS